MKQARGRPSIHRKSAVLSVALRLAEVHGYQNVTREMLAKEAGTSDGLISNLFGPMVQLRRTIMVAAIITRNLKIIAQGIAASDVEALSCDPELKKAAIETLL